MDPEVYDPGDEYRIYGLGDLHTPVKLLIQDPAAATSHAVGSAYGTSASSTSAFHSRSQRSLAGRARKIDYANYYAPPSTKRVLGERGLAAINALLALGPGWDGFTARPVSDEAALAAMRALLAVGDDYSLTPQFFPLVDGGIQIEWHADGDSIEIEIDRAGDSHILAVNPAGEVVLDEDDGGRGASDAWKLAAERLQYLSDRVRHRS